MPSLQAPPRTAPAASRQSRAHNYPPRWNAAPSQKLLIIYRNHKTSEGSTLSMGATLRLPLHNYFGVTFPTMPS
jgi:hypothetical protein